MAPRRVTDGPGRATGTGAAEVSCSPPGGRPLLCRVAVDPTPCRALSCPQPESPAPETADAASTAGMPSGGGRETADARGLGGFALGRSFDPGAARSLTEPDPHGADIDPADLSS